MLEKMIIAVYAILNFLSPKLARRVAYSSYPDCSDNAYAMFLHAVAKENDSTEHILLVSNKVASTAKVRRDIGELWEKRSIRIVRKNTILGGYYHLTAKVIYLTHGTFWFARSGFRQCVVNLWHGMPLKKIAFLEGKKPRHVTYAQYTIASSPIFKGIMSKAFGIPEEKVWVTGQPRNDWFFDPKIPSINFRKDKDYRKVVLWMPTYRISKVGDIRRDSDDAVSELPLVPMNRLAELDAMLHKNNVMCIIKLHGMDILNEEKFPTLANIRIIRAVEMEQTGINLYSLIKSSDCLVSDYSSVFIDYLMLGRPLGLITADIDSYKRGFVFEGDINQYLAGQKIRSYDELAAFMCSANVAQQADVNQPVFNSFSDAGGCERVSRHVQAALAGRALQSST